MKEQEIKAMIAQTISNHLDPDAIFDKMVEDLEYLLEEEGVYDYIEENEAVIIEEFNNQLNNR